MRILNNVYFVCCIIFFFLLCSSLLFDGYLRGYNDLDDKVIYFNIAACIFVVVFFIRFLHADWTLDRIDLAILFFVLFVIANRFFKVKTYDNYLSAISLSLLFYFSAKSYLRSERRKDTLISYLMLVFLVFGIIEALIAAYQWYRIVVRGQFNELLLGSFINSDVLANYLGVIFVFSLTCYLFSEKLPGLNKLIKNLSLAFIILVVIILPSTQSRGAFIAIVIIALMLLNSKYKITSKIASVFKYLTGLSAIGIVCALLVFGYNFKKDSADGRVVIWRTSAILVKSNPISGIGFGQFQYKFPDAQASYFKIHPVEAQKFSDKDDYAFNDFLQLMVENGIIGLLSFLLIGYFLLKSYLRSPLISPYARASFWGICFLFIVALISYPFEIISHWFTMMFFMLLLAVETQTKPVLTAGPLISRLSSAIVVFFCVFILYKQRNMLVAKSAIISGREYMVNEDYTEAVSEFTKAMIHAPNEKPINLELGKCYLLLKDNNAAVKFLTAAKPYLSDPFLSSNLGEAYANLKQFDESEDAYLDAIRMMPNRLYPRYQLVKMYVKSNQKGKARQLAKQIMSMPIKVPSAATETMRTEISKLLKSSLTK